MGQNQPPRFVPGGDGCSPETGPHGGQPLSPVWVKRGPPRFVTGAAGPRSIADLVKHGTARFRAVRFRPAYIGLHLISGSREPASAAEHAAHGFDRSAAPHGIGADDKTSMDES